MQILVPFHSSNSALVKASPATARLAPLVGRLVRLKTHHKALITLQV